ncbi:MULTISPECIES: hypothetical protein [unclassified Methylobacterium]|uniref:hypothetical protein n=1 Tax=unclassified Methylobacterium TaxID=2615210 RepID=UPI00226A808A|nr:MULTISPECIES: hypothetical protein [unclassified Methylobacterium]
MADDKLRIVAQLDDQVSGPLSKVESALKRTSDQTKGAAASMTKEWSAFKGVLGQTNTALSTFAAPLAALGIAGGGAALSLGALGGALRGFSQNTQALDILSRQTGITTKTLQALESMGERVGISGQTMLGAADNFSRAATKLKRGWGEAMQELPAMNLGWLLNDLRSAKSVEEMMDKLFQGLPKISNLEARRRVLTIFFGTEDIDKIIQQYGDQAATKLQEIRKSVADITPEARQAAKEFEDMLGRWNTAVEKAKVWALTPVLKGLVTLFEDVEKHGLRGNEGEQALRNQLSPFGGPEATPREKLEGRRAQVQSQLDLLEKGPRGADFERKRDRMTEELARVADELRKLREQGATAQPSSFEVPGGAGATIQKASFGGGPAIGVPRSFGGAGIFGGPGGGSGGGFGYGGAGGGAGRARDVPDAPAIGDSLGGRSSRGGGALGGSRGPLEPEMPIGDRGMLDLIAKAEGTTHRGYNDSFAHQVGGDLTGKTLGEIEQVQRSMRGSSAIGRYQFMRGTLFGGGHRGDRGLTGELGLSRDDKFTPELQDRLANALIERRYREAKRAQAKQGGDFMRHFRTALAREWASFPGDYGQRGRNGGMYPGQSASIGRDRLTEGARRWLDEREGRTAKAIPPDPTRPLSPAKPAVASNDPDFFPNGAPRVLKPNSMKDAPGLTADDAARRREAFKNGSRRPDVLADPNDERRQGDKPFYSEEDDRRAARDLGIALRDRRHRAEAETSAPDRWKDPPRKSAPQKDAGADLMQRFYARGTGPGGAMQMPGAQASGGRGTLHIRLEGASPGTKVSHDMDGLFHGVTMSRHRAPEMDKL